MKKLLELIKKLLGMSGSSDSASSSESSEKGFTLLELLVVIAILGVLAAGLLVAIDPVDRIRSANDSQVQKDVASIANAAEAYAATHDGLYPYVKANLTASGDLKVLPTAPTGYTAYPEATVPSGCTAEGDTDCTSFIVVGTLKSKKFKTGTGGPFYNFTYSSLTGKACPMNTANPPVCQP